MNIVIITGVSGSGKSSVLNYLEDKNFYCVDNLPLVLIDKFLEILRNTDYENIAIGIDIREYLIHKDFEKFKNIKNRIENIFILFLDTTVRELYKRYNESRRKHPLNESSLETAIEMEKVILEPIKKDSDFVLDTTNMSLKLLYRELNNLFSLEKNNSDFFINIYSFGFKYGDFKNAHLMFDVRFLPNPFFIKELKHKTGLNSEVYEYVMAQIETKEFLKNFDAMIDYLLPLYKKEGRHYLNIAIGCTGGKHRSVSIAEYLYKKLKNTYSVTITHKEIKGEK